jgi:hypothetical protein
MNTNKTRIKYGFKLDFPETPFTLKNLLSRGAHPQYITAYMRVKNALKAGTIVVAGVKAPTATRRGRKELVYRRSDAKVATLSVSTAKV